jgi:hypothetical protein
MYALRTKYGELPPDKHPFDLAFNDIMDECCVRGDARGELKRMIGKILADRPRKPRSTKNCSSWAMLRPRFTFVTAHADRREVVLINPTGGTELVFRRVKGCVVNTSFSGIVTETHLAQAQEIAEKIFAEKDREAISCEHIRILEEDANHLLVMIADTFEAYISRGRCAHTVVTTVTREGKDVAQHVVPPDLLREAKAIAQEYFKSVGTLPLPFD